MQERGILNQTHRYYSTTHNMKVMSPILTGAYLQTGTHDNPPAEIVAAMGMPVTPALATAQKQEVERG
jgi:NAD(P)H-quinone oxidoreductase subunit K